MNVQELKNTIDGFCRAMKLVQEKSNAESDLDMPARAEIAFFGMYMIFDEGSFDEEDIGDHCRDYPLCDPWHLRGNFVDMFDCGAYTYAVSNGCSFGGSFKIVRFGDNYRTDLFFSNLNEKYVIAVEYKGQFERENGVSLLVSGFVRDNDPEKDFRKKNCDYQY